MPQTRVAMLEEIQNIPKFAQICLSRNQGVELPRNVPYVGMGSSYYAAVAMKYMGLPVLPEPASEYACYIANSKQADAVLISQSGHSSETLWNIGKFTQYTAIVNDPNSPLATADNCNKVIQLHAGEEKESATKTYINTLIALCLGLGVDPSPAVDRLTHSMDQYEQWGRARAQDIAAEFKSYPGKGLVVLGNGPDLATAQQVALILSEVIHRPVLPMTVAQFDHGPKETAANAIVLMVNQGGPEHRRTMTLLEKIRIGGATCIAWEDKSVPFSLSPISSCIPFFYLAAFLSRELGIGKTFNLGGKITRVDSGNTP